MADPLAELRERVDAIERLLRELLSRLGGCLCPAVSPSGRDRGEERPEAND